MEKLWLRFVWVCASLVLAAGLQGQTPEKQSPKASAAESSNPFDSFPSFFAIMNGGIRPDNNRRIYRSGDLLRMDFEDHYRLTDLKKLTMWGVHAKSCSKFAAPDAGSFPFSAYQGYKVVRTPTGETDTVDGHVCKIEDIVFTPEDGMPMSTNMRLWEATDLKGFPIKIEVLANGKKLSISYTDVSLKVPDAKLFILPAKCTTSVNPRKPGAQAPVAPPRKTTTDAPPKP